MNVKILKIKKPETSQKININHHWLNYITILYNYLYIFQNYNKKSFYHKISIIYFYVNLNSKTISVLFILKLLSSWSPSTLYFMDLWNYIIQISILCIEVNLQIFFFFVHFWTTLIMTYFHVNRLLMEKLKCYHLKF